MVDADIEGFFDNLDKGILMRQLRTRVSDLRVLGLIERWLRAGVLAEGTLMHPETGTPQGGVISPLLANVYLNGLDRAFEERHAKLGRMVRNDDDLVLVCWQPWQARKAHDALARELAALGLRLSPGKTRIVELEVAGEASISSAFTSAACSAEPRAAHTSPAGPARRQWKPPGSGSGTSPRLGGLACPPSWSCRTSTAFCAGGAPTSAMELHPTVPRAGPVRLLAAGAVYDPQARPRE